MKNSDFESLVAATNLDPESATVTALRWHLVYGNSVASAATKAGKVSRQVVYAALAKLPRQRCPCCEQWMDPATVTRANRRLTMYGGRDFARRAQKT